MNTIRRVITTVFFCLLLMAGRSQNSFKQQNLPAVKDWFLSTGNWQQGPQLYVREFGTGKDTLLMLHGGWGGDHAGFLDAVVDLSKDFHFIFYDQRGSLRSPFPDSLITFDQHIEDVERLRKEIGVEKLNIVGHSMGAVLASAYAAKYPARIRRLILLAPAGLKNPLPNDERKLADQGFADLQPFLNRPEVTRELDKYNLNRTAPALSSKEETIKFRINLYKRMVFDISKCMDMMGGRGLYKANVFDLTAKTYPKDGWDYVKEFKMQSYPVSVIVGDHDFLDFGNRLGKKWVSEVPRIKLIIIKNAGHLLWFDNQKEFTKQLLSAGRS